MRADGGGGIVEKVFASKLQLSGVNSIGATRLTTHTGTQLIHPHRRVFPTHVPCRLATVYTDTGFST